MFTYRTNRKLLFLAVLLLVFSASDFSGRNARAVVSLDLTPDDVVGNRACPGDFDNNGIVEFADFLSFVAVFNASSGDANYNALMDMDGNDVIDFRDFLLFAKVFGTTCEPPPVVASVTVSPSSASIEEGETQQFSATAYDADDAEISGKTFAWSSSNVSVATIDSSGLATAVDAGSTTITATVDGKSGAATLSVTEPPPVVASVTVSPSSASIEEEETQQFSATAHDADDAEISGKTFTWSSSMTSVATVSPSSGSATTATGVDAGSTTITATVDGKSGTASLTVTDAAPRSRTGTISGRNNYSSGGSVTLSETSDGKLRLSIIGLSTPSAAPDVFVALYTSNNINWPIRGSLPAGAVEFGEVTRQSGNKAWTFTPASGKNIDSWSHLILHCRLINREVGSASLGN
ncbi:MAG: Ig-like domain-containing protein [Gemmatimonadota bacterium]|nr:Ig-like domain-containing protein [Gemmatimonadota bacterium]